MRPAAENILFSPLSALLVLLTLAPLRVLLATEANFPLPLPIGQALLLLYLALWLANRIVQRRPLFQRQRNPILFAVLGLSAVFALGAWQSASVAHWLTEWLKWLAIAALVWTLSLSAAAQWRWLVFAVLLAAAGNALVGLYIFFGGSGADHLLILGRFYRAFGTFGQPNPFGGFMGLALPLALLGAFSQAQILWRGWRASARLNRQAVFLLAAFGLATVLLGAALLASWSRGAWLGSAVAMLVMLIALPRRLLAGLGLAFGLAALLAALWLAGLLPNSIVNRLTTAAYVRGVEINPVNYAVIERLAHWQAAIAMAQAEPFFGVGLGSYEVVYADYRLINWGEALGHAHNYYLNLLAETGIFGLAAYLLFWLFIFWQTWRLRAQPDKFARACAIGLLGCWSYIAVHSVFDKLYVNNLFLHIGVLLTVLAILQRQLKHTLELE